MQIRLHQAVISGIVWFAMLLGGCASLPSADPALDKQAKTFSVPVGQSAIYLYRNEIFGAAVALPVSLDGQAMGKTGAKTYFRWEVNPGNHEIVSGGESGARLSVATEPNKIYFVWQEVKLGAFSAGTALHQVDEQTGRDAVRQCSLLASAKSSPNTVATQTSVTTTPVPQNVNYPHAMNGADITAHYAQYHQFDANRQQRPFTLTVSTDSDVKRTCPTCNVTEGRGRMTIKTEESLVCFDWQRVTYPASGCFKLVQLSADTYRLQPVNGTTVIDYSPRP